MTIECDSRIIVDAIRFGQIEHWRLIHLYRLCRQHLPGSYTIHHSFRQTNIMADRLAAWAHIHLDQVESFQERNLPKSIRVAIRADQLGLWNF